MTELYKEIPIKKASKNNIENNLTFCILAILLIGFILSLLYVRLIAKAKNDIRIKEEITKSFLVEHKKTTFSTTHWLSFEFIVDHASGLSVYYFEVQWHISPWGQTEKRLRGRFKGRLSYISNYSTIGEFFDLAKTKNKSTKK